VLTVPIEETKKEEERGETDTVKDPPHPEDLTHTHNLSQTKRTEKTQKRRKNTKNPN